MGLSVEKPDVEWYNALPGRGPVYDLVSATAAGSDTSERLRAVAALGTSGDPRAVRPLVNLMSDAYPEIRLAATTALGLLKSGRPVDDLIVRLRDRQEEHAIRQQAAIALASIRSTGAVRGLREFVADVDEDLVLRSYAGNLLNGISSL
jgi:HEAT repeat protein